MDRSPAGWTVAVGAVVCLMLGGCALNPEVRTSADDNSSLIF